MNKWYKDEEILKKFKAFTLAGIIIVIFYFLCSNSGAFKNTIGNFFKVLSPFIWGSILALILLKIAVSIENAFPEKWSKKIKRVLSSIFSVLIAVLIVVVLISILIPNVIDSISKLAVSIETFTTNASSWLTKFSKDFKLSNKTGELIYEYSSQIVESLWNVIKGGIPSIIDITKATFSTISNFFIGFFVAVYILIDRENLKRQIKHLLEAFLSEKSYNRFLDIARLSNDKFNKFFVGKIIDSIIIGILCFILMLIFKLDYSILISVIVTVTNIIPFFGPFIGAIPSALILLIVSPKQALIFIILIFALQQLDGQVIGPRILGDSVGLSSLWIMFSIIVGGAYFGFYGMLLGVPVFAIIYFLIKEYVEIKLKNKEKPKKKK